jgi:hypothetical protein
MRLGSVWVQSVDHEGPCIFIKLDVSLVKPAIRVDDHDRAVQRRGKISSKPGLLIERLAEWLHRALRKGGIPIVCIETRQAQRSGSFPRARSGQTTTAG